MTLPKEQERKTSVSGRQQSAPPTAQAGEYRTTGPNSAWQMPGGEDLLNFALSAGLAAGAWWLELQQAPAEAAAAEPERASMAERRPR